MKLHAILLTTVLLAGCSQAPSNAVDSQAAPAEDAKTPASAAYRNEISAGSRKLVVVPLTE